MSALTTAPVSAVLASNLTGLGQLAMSPNNITSSPPQVINRRQERSEEQANKKVLYTRSGLVVRLWPDGMVNATKIKNPTQNKRPDYSTLKFVMYWNAIHNFFSKTRMQEPIQFMSIQGEKSGYYMCMNKDGKLYGSKQLNETECKFEVHRQSHNHAYVYCSKAYKRTDEYKTKMTKACVGFKRNGRPKNGFKVKEKNKGAQFIDVEIDRTRESNFQIPPEWNHDTTESPLNKPPVNTGVKSKQRTRKRKKKGRRRKKKKVPTGKSSTSESSTTVSGIFVVSSNKEKLDSVTSKKSSTIRKQRHRKSRQRNLRRKKKFGKNLFS